MQMVPKTSPAVRVRIAAGRIASKREELEHLRERVRLTTINFATWESHHNEIAKAQAEQLLEDFLEKNPWLR